MVLLNAPVGLGRQPPVKKADAPDSTDGHSHIVFSSFFSLKQTNRESASTPSSASIGLGAGHHEPLRTLEPPLSRTAAKDALPK